MEGDRRPQSGSGKGYGTPVPTDLGEEHRTLANVGGDIGGSWETVEKDFTEDFGWDSTDWRSEGLVRENRLCDVGCTLLEACSESSKFPDGRLDERELEMALLEDGVNGGDVGGSWDEVAWVEIRVGRFEVGRLIK